MRFSKHAYNSIDMFYFAESQVRLLLCLPQHRAAVSEKEMFHWRCGCTGTHQAGAPMAIEACDYHRGLLAAVTPVAEEQIGGTGYRFVPAMRHWRAAGD